MDFTKPTKELLAAQRKAMGHIGMAQTTPEQERAEALRHRERIAIQQNIQLFDQYRREIDPGFPAWRAQDIRNTASALDTIQQLNAFLAEAIRTGRKLVDDIDELLESQAGMR